MTDDLGEIRIKPGEHVAILGMTGGGKTVLADYLLTGLDRVIVVDPKNEFRKQGFTRLFTLDPWYRTFRLVWAPKRSEDLKLAGLLRRAWKRRNLTIYVDELQSLTDFFPASTAVLSDIIRTGRSRKVSVWIATQRPAWVPRWFLSESRHKFVFTLLDKADRRRASEVIGDAAKDPVPVHTFLYHRPGLTGPMILRYNLRQKQIERAPTPAAVPDPTGG
jgi:ABC-type dipeptide/oligopeptide/nickel transport system ATPase component